MSEPAAAETLADLLPLSPDHNAERLAALRRLFPDLFTNEGRLNVDELRKVVDPALVAETERYDFRWYGKTASKRDAFTPSRAALVRDPARSVNPEKAGGNLIIEGENLEVLKLLSSAYRERVKCIYIDPPYNTGKDFVYSDRFAEGQRPYWEQTGVTEDGVKVDTNTDSDGRFHSNWLSMMHSRLLVARYLLREDGIVFVSVDDNEITNLRRLLDDVFGSENFICVFVWRRRQQSDSRNQNNSSTDHEYIAAYSRSGEACLEGKLIDTTKYKNPDADPRGPWASIDLSGLATQDQRPNLHFDIVDPATGIAYPPNPNRGWSKSRGNIEQMISDGKVLFPPSGSGRPREKKFLAELQSEITGFSTWLDSIRIGFTTNGTREVSEIFGDKVFDFPKPVALIQTLLAQTTSEDDLILDFFAGSGTTAQAVMELNKADGGNRQFILVQLPELTAADSPAHKAGFKRISDITIERARRVIARLQAGAEGLLPNDPQRQFADNLGFSVFRLAQSAFPRVEFAPDPDQTEAENVDRLRQYIRDKEATFHFQWARETVLDEVLLKHGFMLDYTLTRCPEFTRNEVFLARDAHKESLLCLDPVLDAATVDHFKTHHERFFICLELALDTTKKWNLKHHLGDKLKAF